MSKRHGTILNNSYNIFCTMKRSTRFIPATVIVLVIIAAIVAFIQFNFVHLQIQAPVTTPVATTTEPLHTQKTDPLNISYTINNESYTLVQGKVEQPSTIDSVIKTSLSIFGLPIYGDLDKDGDADAAILLTYTAGGSGTFYYAVFATNVNGVYKSTNTLFLGDRIAPQTVEIMNGNAVYNYAERAVGEPMTTPPSRGKSLWVHLNPKTNEIGELVQNFEGEANPSIMRLDQQTWTWTKTEYANRTPLTPRKPGLIKITFVNDGHFTVKTDCNSMGGKYTAIGNSLVLSEIVSTMMYCEGSDGGTFSQMLSDVRAYHFTSKGELIFDLENSLGSSYFK